MNENEKPAEYLNPTQLPSRYWTAIDLLGWTLEQAQAAWAKEQAAGVEFDAL